MTVALLGWGGFTWRRAEDAVKVANNASSHVDRVELKVAEFYLTKKEFELSMDRLFSTLTRLEGKLDTHVFHQDERIQALKGRLRDLGERREDYGGLS